MDADGVTACIIDYSRSVLGPGPASRPGACDTDAQWPVITRLFRRYAPGITDDALLLKLAKAPCGEVFGLLCAVDYIAIGASLKAVAAEAANHRPEPGEKRPFVVAPGMAAMASRVEEISRAYLVAGLQRMARGEQSLGPSLWKLLCSEMFAPWRAETRAAGHNNLAIADAYNFTNELTYSGTDYARFPPWARLDEIQKRLGGRPLTEVIPQGETPLLESMLPKVRPEVVAEEARQELATLDT